MSRVFISNLLLPLPRVSQDVIGITTIERLLSRRSKLLSTGTSISISILITPRRVFDSSTVTFAEEPIEEKKPEVKEEVMPEPIVPKAPPKPVKKEVKKKPEVEKKPKKKTVKKKTVKKKQVAQKASSRKMKISAAQKNQFLASIRAKINKHKSYPRIAKKRGMQGSVDVKFTILSNGNVGNISVKGPKVFHKSARKAVKSAFPINVKNAPVALPQSINIKLLYQIR